MPRLPQVDDRTRRFAYDLEVSEALPKTPTQKIQKNRLRDNGIGAGVWDREAAGITVRKVGR